MFCPQSVGAGIPLPPEVIMDGEITRETYQVLAKATQQLFDDYPEIVKRMPVSTSAIIANLKAQNLEAAKHRMIYLIREGMYGIPYQDKEDFKGRWFSLLALLT
jgi:hypothetical protein